MDQPQEPAVILISREGLETAPVGLYRVKGEAKRGDVYDISGEVMRRDVDLVMMARVRNDRIGKDGKVLDLRGCDEVIERPDGKIIIYCWTIPQPAEQAQ